MADAALDAARREAPGLALELYLVRGRDRSLERREGRPEMTTESVEEGMGLRLGDGKALAAAASGGLSAESAADLARRAKAQLSLLTPDPSGVGRAGGPAAAAAAAALPATLMDPDVFKAPLQCYAPRLDELAARARRADRRVKRILNAGFGASLAEVAIVSTAGARAYERGSSASLGLTLGAVSGGGLQLGSGSRLARPRST